MSLAIPLLAPTRALFAPVMLAPSRRDIQKLLNLAIPVTVVQVGMMLMGVADSMMVGRVSPEALAAVALGNLYFLGLSIFGMGTLMALDPVVSQAVGHGDREGVARAVQRGMLMALVISIPVSMLLIPGEYLLSLIGQPEEVIPIAAGYARACIPGVFPFLAFAVLRQTLQAMTIVRPVVVVVLLANVLNVFLNWVLIFGKLGVTGMGAVGTGWASSIGRVAMLAGVLLIAWPVLKPAFVPFRRDALALAPIGRMLRIGVPIGLQHQLEMGAFGFAAVVMGWFGAVEMAAHQIAINLASLTFMVPVGIGVAGSVVVGQAVGRGDTDEARRSAAGTTILGMSVMVLSALVFLTVPGFLARLYTDSPAVVGLASLLIPIAGVFQVFDGLQVVSSGVLRGIGDTRAPMVVNLLGFWLIGIPCGVALAFRTSLGPRGVWWGLTIGLVLVSVMLAWRVRNRFGREIVRLHIEDVPSRSAA